MNTTNLFGAPQAAAALSLIGATALGENRNDLYKQIFVAVANKTGGGGGTGDVVGPASSTDGAVALWDGITGKLLKDSSVFLTGSGTVAFGTGPFTLTVPATGTAAILGIANIFSANGAASAPAFSLTGTPFTGGTSTTTKPLFLIEPAGTTSTGWNTDGTMLGVNAPSGFIGRLFTAHLNGASAFSVAYNGSIRCGTDGSVPFAINGLYGLVSFTQLGDGALQMDHSLRTTGSFIIDGANQLFLNNSGAIINFNNDASLSRPAAGVIALASGNSLRLGNAATTGLSAGVLAGSTNASIVIQDSTGQAYRIPCII